MPLLWWAVRRSWLACGLAGIATKVVLCHQGQLKNRWSKYPVVFLLFAIERRSSVPMKASWLLPAGRHIEISVALIRTVFKCHRYVFFFFSIRNVGFLRAFIGWRRPPNKYLLSESPPIWKPDFVMFSSLIVNDAQLSLKHHWITKSHLKATTISTISCQELIKICHWSVWEGIHWVIGIERGWNGHTSIGCLFYSVHGRLFRLAELTPTCKTVRCGAAVLCLHSPYCTQLSSSPALFSRI